MQASLPRELLSEPYSYTSTDKLVRTVRRSRRFYCYIDGSGGSLCLVGHFDFYTSLNYYEDTSALRKRTSTVSVQSVYDLYGLEVTKKYLAHLQLHKNNFWTRDYLRGSLFELTEEYRDETSFEVLVKLLEVELDRVDACQPVLATQLVEQTLPVELLARITQRRDLSSSISKSLSSVGYVHYPTVIELESLHCATDARIVVGLGTTSRNHLICGNAALLVLLCNSDGTLLQRSVESVSLCNSISIEYSLSTYDKFWSRQDTDRMLVTLRERVCKITLSNITNSDMIEICSWIMQLSWDTDPTLSYFKDDELNSLDHARPKLVSLIDLALRQRASRL